MTWLACWRRSVPSFDTPLVRRGSPNESDDRNLTAILLAEASDYSFPTVVLS